jgi:hypothetical protein
VRGSKRRGSVLVEQTRWGRRRRREEPVEGNKRSRLWSYESASGTSRTTFGGERDRGSFLSWASGTTRRWAEARRGREREKGSKTGLGELRSTESRSKRGEGPGGLCWLSLGEVTVKSYFLDYRSTMVSISVQGVTTVLVHPSGAHE